MLREKYSQKSRERYRNVNYKTKFIWIVGYGLCNKNGKGKLVFEFFSQHLKRCMLREKMWLAKPRKVSHCKLKNKIHLDNRKG